MEAIVEPVLRLHAEDNVVVARHRIAAATAIATEGLVVRTEIPAGHKIASRRIPHGEPVRKYGQIIGFASRAIEAGEHVHVHNVEVRSFLRDHAYGSEVRPVPMVPEAERHSFRGYLREDGRVGTRNYLGVLSTVNCSATVCHMIRERFPADVLARHPEVDGIVAFTHGTGCGMADRGEGFAALQRTLWGFARHPNLAGVLIIGLGCEVNQIEFLREAYGLSEGPLFRSLTLQESGGTLATVERAIAMLAEMLPVAGAARRQEVAASELVLALQCGGSDAYSGITANPALGHAADLLVAEGGTAILSETPEIYGAEHLLTRRAVRREVGEKLVERIRWWEEYTRRNGGEMNNNPSPGNKAGGLTTILEKSLGAAAKGGTSPLTDVLLYGEPLRSRGFVFMDSPGYDPCSVTGQVASGANLIAFTTGRGSCFGFKPVPCLKIATNSPMYRRMEADMDLDCGTILEGRETVQQAGRRIFERLLDLASGEPSKSERLGIGDHEFVPWQIGAVM